MRDRYFYLEFAIGSVARFESLADMFVALKAEKDRIIASFESDTPENAYDPAADPQWIGFLDDTALLWFANTFDYNSEEGVTFQQLWNLTSPEIRLSHQMFHVPGNWDFDSMIDSLFNSEYAFVDLVKETEQSGSLYYKPWAWPFGGTESMVALIESFGHNVTFDSWHDGPHRRQRSEWNYQLAKELVALGKGFTPN